MRKLLMIAAMLSVAVVCSWAQFVDPQIAFGAVGVCPPTCGADPNIILPGATQINAYAVSGGWDLLQPWTLILGIPNVNNPALAPVVTAPAGTVGLGLGGIFNGPEDVNAYNVLGIATELGGASENYENWFNVAPGLYGGPTPGFYGLFEYTIMVNAYAHTALPITFDRGLALGTIVIGYGFGTNNGGQQGIFFTPFTNAGLVAPEPASVLLLGAVLVGIGTLWRRKRSRTA